ncbi:hypothetical protein EGW08_017295 [Elysia chlorotica]|uniref:Sushi domain-containing protein n=1 Tax=Elysia chlorotica TaxID=188477 RepID=A0A3S0ZB63_ELYCH|nr:hypothetical protein EGW08_017295 [Elysia chlorotica]
MKSNVLSQTLVCLFFTAVVLETCEAAGRRRARKCPKLDLPNGRVRIRSRGKTAQFSCNSGYTLMGERLTVCLQSRAWSLPVPTCAGLGCPAPELSTNVKVTQKYQGAMLTFLCKQGLTRIGPESIFCDGKTWSNSPPRCISTLKDMCDFEDEYLCGWSNDASDDFDWTRNSGKTPTDGTGPTTDHTLKTDAGHYMFIESSAPRRRGDVAKLVSPIYNPGQVDGICLDFYYHMYGNHDPAEVGDLDLLAIRSTTSKGDKPLTIFHQSGNQGDRWIKADVDIPKMDSPLQLVFQATRLRGWSSDIAIDDIRMYNCSERPETTLPATTTTLPTTTTTTTTTTSTTTTSPTTTLPTTTTSTTTSTTTTASTAPSTTTTTTTPTAKSSTTTTFVITAKDLSSTEFPTTPSTPVSSIALTSNPETKTGIYLDVDASIFDIDNIDNTSKSPTVDSKGKPHSAWIGSSLADRWRESNTSFFATDAAAGTSSSTVRPRDPLQTGEVREQGSSSRAGMLAQLPMILGVAGGVFVLAVIVSVVAYAASRKHRTKQQRKEEEEQMNIITEFVETNLNG